MPAVASIMACVLWIPLGIKAIEFLGPKQLCEGGPVVWYFSGNCISFGEL